MSGNHRNDDGQGLVNLSSSGGVFFSLTDERAGEVARREGKDLTRVFIDSLEKDVWPERFRAQRGSFTARDQARLLESTAAIIGAGGLGGMVCLLLARAGIGNLIVCDGDSFEQSNLNRQMLSDTATLGKNKALTAAEKAGLINPGLKVKAFPCWAGESNIEEIIGPAQVVVDCLDNMETRFMVERAARTLGRPFIHGAVAGFEGLMMTVLPAGPGLVDLYGPVPAPKRETAESLLGVPTVTPAILAGLQVQEALNILLGRPLLAGNRLLHLDLGVPAFDVNELA
ncbi:MAG: HesA/MoeB/ThiF family protein [Pseudomonadota bacterium]